MGRRGKAEGKYEEGGREGRQHVRLKGGGDDKFTNIRQKDG